MSEKQKYAIIKSGGSQHRVEEGRWVDLELLHQEEGAKVNFPVLMVVDGEKVSVGTPELKKAKVTGKVVNPDFKGKKVTFFRYRPKKGYTRKQGHRQRYTRVLIEKISS